MNQGNLADFGGGVEPPETPYLKDISEVLPNQKKFGAFGLDSNLKCATLNCRRRDDGDRFEKYNGYSFRKRGLDSLRKREITAIYVMDLTMGDVYEYEFDQYYGSHAIEYEYSEPMICVPVKYATTWEDAAQEFVEKSVDITWEQVTSNTK